MITNKQIEKWNSEFKAMSKAEKRVAIAKDVIAQIKAKRYIPKTGDYISFISTCGLSVNDSIQKNFDKVECQVCGIGSMFMSNIKFTNKFTLESIPHSGVKQAQILLKYFSKQDLILIECIFEDWEDIDGTIKCAATDHKPENLTDRQIKKLETARKAFYNKDAEIKLLNMMKHLVKNKGNFVL